MKNSSIVTALSLCLAASVILLCGCVDDDRIQSYNAGVEAYNANDFYTAREHFVNARGYSNSASYLDAINEYERIYLAGVEQLEARNYQEAYNIFNSIVEFGNSAEYVDYIDGLKALYDEGVGLYQACDYIAARDCFERASGYASSQTYIENIDSMEEFYRAAMELYNAHRYREAIVVFEAIGAAYRDTYDKLTELYGRLEIGSIHITDYLKAYGRSYVDSGNAVAFPLTDINETGFMVSDSRDVLFIGNTDEYGYITSVSFWISNAIVQEYGDEGVRSMLAHCIRALNIEMTTYEDILANMDDYTSGVATYGNFSFALSYDDSGYVVLTATYAYGG